MSTSNFGTSPPHLPVPIGQNNTQPHLSYYISRTNGTLVPLIPADELPFNLRLQGVPRVLNNDQVFALQHIATLPFTGSTFKLEDDRTMVRSLSQPHEAAHARSNSGPDTQKIHHSDVLVVRPRSSHNTPASVIEPPRSVPAHETATTWRKPAPSDPQTVIDAIARTKGGEETAPKLGYIPRRPLPPSGKEPDQDKKQYCTHWIRYGECDYTQQGCLYKHEMPDKATLLKIGFRSTPRWWLDKNRPKLFEGPRGAVGAVMKPAVWLKTVKAAESMEMSSSGSEVSDEESSDEEVVVKGQGAKGKVAKKNGPVRQTKPQPAQQSIIAESSKHKESITTDLMTFEPLIPAPALSSTPSTASCSSSGDSDHSKKNTPVTAQTPFSATTKHDHKKLKANVNVFVPAGEDRESHIADAKAKAERKRARLAAKKAKTQQGVAVVEAAQAPKTQHVQSGLMISKHAVENGLMASKHAPTSVEDAQVVRVRRSHRHRRGESGQA